MIAGLLSGFADRVFNSSLENPRYSLSDPETYEMLTQGMASEAGICITPRVAMSLAPVWQGLSIISGDLAASTAHVFQRNNDGSREIDYSHPADFLISEEANDETPACLFWRRLIIHALLWPNGGFAWIQRSGRNGSPQGLYNLLPDRTVTKRDEKGTLYYQTEIGGEIFPLLKEEVIHITNMSTAAGCSCGLVDFARNAWGLSLAAEGFGSKFFANGAQTGGIIEVPKGTTEKAQENLESSVQKKFSKKENWFKTMVLREGAKFHSTTIDAQKSQLTELREAQVRDTARFFNLPPAKLGLQDSVSYNSAEQAQIQYITGCLTHWFSALRGELQMKLLSPVERRSRTRFIEYNASKLIERDLKTQVEILQIERQNEIINANEWRKKRDLPPREDAQAEEYINPNTRSAASSSSSSGNSDTKTDGESGSSQQPTPATGEPSTNQLQDSTRSPRMEAAMRSLLADALARMARRSCHAVRKAAKSGLEFQDLVDSRCASQHKGFDETLEPVTAAVGAFIERDAASLCGELRVRFFSSLIDAAGPALDGPASTLETTVCHACELFEATIAGSLCDSVFSDTEIKHAA